MVIKRFEVVPTKLTAEEPLVVKNAYIEFYENYMIYSIEMTALKKADEDENMPGVEQPVYFKDVIVKSFIAGISKSWREKLKRWHIRISVTGIADDSYVWFKKQQDCDEMMEYLVSWLGLK